VAIASPSRRKPVDEPAAFRWRAAHRFASVAHEADMPAPDYLDLFEQWWSYISAHFV